MCRAMLMVSGRLADHCQGGPESGNYINGLSIMSARWTCGFDEINNDMIVMISLSYF